MRCRHSFLSCRSLEKHQPDMLEAVCVECVRSHLRIRGTNHWMKNVKAANPRIPCAHHLPTLNIICLKSSLTKETIKVVTNTAIFCSILLSRIKTMYNYEIHYNVQTRVHLITLVALENINYVQF